MKEIFLHFKTIITSNFFFSNTNLSLFMLMQLPWEHLRGSSESQQEPLHQTLIMFVTRHMTEEFSADETEFILVYAYFRVGEPAHNV